jgi:hypothetical protein
MSNNSVVARPRDLSPEEFTPEWYVSWREQTLLADPRDQKFAGAVLRFFALGTDSFTGSRIITMLEADQEQGGVALARSVMIAEFDIEKLYDTNDLDILRGEVSMSAMSIEDEALGLILNEQAKRPETARFIMGAQVLMESIHATDI